MGTERVEGLYPHSEDAEQLDFTRHLMVGGCVLVALFVVSRSNFLLFHSISELFSIAVAWSVFLLMWNGRRFMANDALVFLGIAYLFIGGIDLVHTLAYKGMGIFPSTDEANITLQLWIGGRGLEALSLLLFPLLLGRRSNLYISFVSFAVATALLLAAVFLWHIFPTCYVEGSGLTPFKKGSEYLICLVLLVAMVLLWRRRERLDTAIYRLLLLAMGATIAAELAFTLYVGMHGLLNVIGHSLKITSFYLTYMALIHSGLNRPYALLFRELEENQTERLSAQQRSQAENAVRLQIALMEDPRDLSKVVAETERQLQKLGVSFDTLALQVINAEGTDFLSIGTSAATPSHPLWETGLSWSSITRHVHEYPWVTQVWQTKTPRYDPCTKPEDSTLETGISLIDVPFSQGTLSINRQQPHAFTEDDIVLLQGFADMISDGFQRFQDLTERKQAEEALAQEYRLRDADNAIRIAVASINEPQDLQGVLVEIASQLTQLGVTHDAISLQIVNAEGTSFLSVTSHRGKNSDWNAMWDRFDCVVQNGTISFRSPRYEEELTEGSLKQMQVVIDVWKRGTFRYEPCTPEGLGLLIPGISVVDVAFSHGTLAINREQPHAFGDESIAHLQRFARIISGGFERFLHVVESKQLTQELIRVQRLRAAGELSAGVSHNLNNILSSILGPAQLLERMTDDPAILRETGEIISAGRRARDLVHKLHLSVRGIEESSLQLVSVDAIVQETIQATRPRWKDEPESRGIGIEIATQLAEPPPIQGNGSGLHEILTNLIFNAVDAMPDGGTITIETQQVANQVQLTVCDTGIGMDEETRRRVFEPFFTTKMDVGTGLGLSTAYNTVMQWGGTMDVDSIPGEGTTFILRLPIWKEEAIEKSETKEERRVRPGRVLIIDDDPGVCSMLSRLLGQVHEVETIMDGRSALEQFTPGKYDAVLIDLGMSGMSGDRVATELRQRDLLVSTVLITGWELDEDDPRKAPFDLRLTKPFGDLDAIEEAVVHAIELHDDRVGKEG